MAPSTPSLSPDEELFRRVSAKEDLHAARFYHDPILGTWEVVWRNWPAGAEALSWWEGVRLSGNPPVVVARIGGGRNDRLPRDVVPSTHALVDFRMVPEAVVDAVYAALLEGL